MIVILRHGALLLAAAAIVLGQGGGAGEPDFGGRETEAPVYISGSVLMSDGAKVPKETIAELICGGFPRATDQVSGKGEFDIDLSGSSRGVADATRGSNRAEGVPQGNNLGVIQMSGCIVRAELPGYQSTEIQLSTRSTFDNPDVGDLVLTRLEGIVGDMVSGTLVAAPKGAVKLYEKAKKEGGKPRSDLKKMAGWLETAVGEYPEFATAWDLLGQVRKGLGLNAEAIEAFESAIAADPQFIAPYVHVTPLLVRSGNMARTIEVGRQALALNPHLDEVRFFLAGALLRSGDSKGSIETAEMMIERGSADGYPQAYQFLGAAYANLRDFKMSAKHFRRFLEVSPNATAAEPIRKQLAEWEKLGAIPPAQD